MWYTTDKGGYSWDELINLYKIVDNRERAFRDDLFRFTNFYSAVCYAILAVTLSGFVTLYSKGIIVLALLIGPLLTLCMCLLGISVTSKIYRRIIRETSIKAKLENALGLDSQIPVNQFLGKETLWEKDKFLLSPRQGEVRKEYPSSEEFIEAYCKRGFHKSNKIYFGLIGTFAFILAITIIVVTFVGKF